MIFCQRKARLFIYVLFLLELIIPSAAAAAAAASEIVDALVKI